MTPCRFGNEDVCHSWREPNEKIVKNILIADFDIIYSFVIPYLTSPLKRKVITIFHTLILRLRSAQLEFGRPRYAQFTAALGGWRKSGSLYKEENPNSWRAASTHEFPTSKSMFLPPHGSQIHLGGLPRSHEGRSLRGGAPPWCRQRGRSSMRCRRPAPLAASISFISPSSPPPSPCIYSGPLSHKPL